MDTHPHRPDDLSSLERRLAACAPAAAGLDADAMLFAAGRASARPGPARFVWPALAACLAGLAVVLGTWLAAERSERLALAQRLRQAPAPVPTPSPPSSSAAPLEPSTAEEPPPNSLLAAHKALEHGLDAWPAQPVTRTNTTDPPASASHVLQVGRPDRLPDL
jgi:hypothetical protein